MTEQELQHKEMRNKQWAQMWTDLSAQGWETIPLWENGTPDFHPEYNQIQPRLLLSPTREITRGVVIISAGGGFRYKTYLEAAPTAEVYIKEGFHVAILDYRCLPYTRADALADVKRAIRMLRCHASEYHIDPSHIAVCGFSAGGVISNMAAALYDPGNPNAEDVVERVSSRPDAAVICYGAMDAATALNGRAYDREAQAEAAQLSPLLNLPFDAPPYFIFQTTKDDPRHGLNLAQALTQRGISMELHIFKDGRHGQALYDGQNGTEHVPHTAHWAPLACEWLKEQGF